MEPRHSFVNTQRERIEFLYHAYEILYAHNEGKLNGVDQTLHSIAQSMEMNWGSYHNDRIKRTMEYLLKEGWMEWRKSFGAYITHDGVKAIEQELASGELGKCISNNGVTIDWSKADNSSVHNRPTQNDLSNDVFIDNERIEQLKSINSQEFDLSRLIRLCEELNITFGNKCYFAVAMLTRSILDHIPPVFGFDTFDKVANNYGSKSFKKSMQNLQNSSRNIADAHLHLPIRQKEVLYQIL